MNSKKKHANFTTYKRIYILYDELNVSFKVIKI